MTPFDQCVEQACRFAGRPHKLFINGNWVDSQSDDVIRSENPSTGDIWAEVQAASVQDVDDAANAAQACFAGSWSRVRPKERERLLRRFAELVEQNGDLICALDAHDSGRLFSGSRNQRIGDANITTLLDTIHYFAGWPTKVSGQSFALVDQPGGQQKSMQSIREPIGVVACILPWNAPALFMINKVVPALAAGCTTIVKPAEQTPVSALYLAELFREAGFPDGTVNVINGYGHVAGAALSSHPLVKKISFTGSTMVGQRISQAAAASFKRLTLELGGKTAFIVMDDADINTAAIAARLTGYGNAGQFCMCPSRLFVEESIRDKFIEKIAALSSDIVVGDALSPDTNMGPVITRKDRDRIASMVDTARQEGADVVFGGDIVDHGGNFYQPTLLHHGNTDISIARDEVFGPVLLTVPFRRDNLDRLLDQANETRFGLAASVWTSDLSTARRMTERLEAGICTVNMHPGIDPMMEFGGIKDSGIGREFGKAGMESFYESKSIHMMV